MEDKRLMDEHAVKIFETRCAFVSLVADNIVLLEEKPNAMIELADAVETSAEVNKLHGDGKWGLLVDIRNMKSVTKEARDYYGHEDTAPFCCACALLVNSYFSTLIANFFISFTKLSKPTKLFSSKEEAIEWLKRILLVENKME
jgi:hypothetical protein